MKIYTGIKTNFGPNDIFVINNGVETILDPEPSQNIYNHSPDGFNWGYSGSGPSQAALAILFDCLGKKAAILHYHNFKFDHVSKWGNSFKISIGEIRDWLKNNYPS